MPESPTWRDAQATLGLLDGRWVIRVLAELHDGPRRYRDLHERLDGISHKVLTDTVHRLERDGLLTRALDTDRHRSTAVYQLSDLASWSRDHWDCVEIARHSWDRESD